MREASAANQAFVHMLSCVKVSGRDYRGGAKIRNLFLPGFGS